MCAYPLSREVGVVGPEEVPGRSLVFTCAHWVQQRAIGFRYERTRSMVRTDKVGSISGQSPARTPQSIANPPVRNASRPVIFDDGSNKAEGRVATALEAG
ncbi:hypothetical protein GCM10010307_78820 [Streptomyces vastus]|uniref:Uncharacterized protein n=1 Tax=Streptomyces vastus TaxID=285451 RepID=A0ABN3RU82_9ACTN